MFLSFFSEAIYSEAIYNCHWRARTSDVVRLIVCVVEDKKFCLTVDQGINTGTYPYKTIPFLRTPVWFTWLSDLPRDFDFDFEIFDWLRSTLWLPGRTRKLHSHLALSESISALQVTIQSWVLFSSRALSILGRCGGCCSPTGSGSCLYSARYCTWVSACWPWLCQEPRTRTRASVPTTWTPTSGWMPWAPARENATLTRWVLFSFSIIAWPPNCFTGFTFDMTLKTFITY